MICTHLSFVRFFCLHHLLSLLSIQFENIALSDTTPFPWRIQHKANATNTVIIGIETVDTMGNQFCCDTRAYAKARRLLVVPAKGVSLRVP